MTSTATCGPFDPPPPPNSEAYVELPERVKNKDISTRITPRALENIIRLSTAHAKLRLSNTVEKVDVEAAYGMLSSGGSRGHGDACSRIGRREGPVA